MQVGFGGGLWAAIPAPPSSFPDTVTPLWLLLQSEGTPPIHRHPPQQKPNRGVWGYHQPTDAPMDAASAGKVSAAVRLY